MQPHNYLEASTLVTLAAFGWGIVSNGQEEAVSNHNVAYHSFCSAPKAAEKDNIICSCHQM